jgi:uncharacterized protein (DUF488 family)
VNLATIGYENDTQPAMIARLKAAGVETVVDVRAISSSRKAGFSKTLLAASLAEEGIGYVHLRDLGTPKAGRIAARAGRTEEMRRIFEIHMQEPAAQLALQQAGEIAGHSKAALLCYEADPCACHRHIIAEKLSKALGFQIEDL